MLAGPLEISTFLLSIPIVEMRLEWRESFPDEAGKGTLISSSCWENGAPPELGRDPRGSSRVGTGMLGNFLSCSKGGKDPWGFKREGVISLETSHEKRASSHLQRRTSWFFSSYGRPLSSYDGDLRDPLVWPQERPVSTKVARRPLGFLSSQCRVLGPCLELRTETETSSPVLTWILRFLWSLHRRVRTLLEWRHTRPFSSEL